MHQIVGIEKLFLETKKNQNFLLPVIINFKIKGLF
jgi:hypothetical protein